MGGGIFNKPEADVMIGRDVIIRRNMPTLVVASTRGTTRRFTTVARSVPTTRSTSACTSGARGCTHTATHRSPAMTHCAKAVGSWSWAVPVLTSATRRYSGTTRHDVGVVRTTRVGSSSWVSMRRWSRNSSRDVGGGIFNLTTFIAQGSARVARNTADTGAGIFNSRNGDVTLAGDARVKANTARTEGGGIYTIGTVTVTDNAKVTANVPDDCVGC